MNIDYPVHVDQRGATASTDRADHLRDLVEQVLFTAPGERVMRPDFGAGVLQLLFAPVGPELAATTSLLVQSALVQWLGDLISVDDVEAVSDEGTLTIEVTFTDRLTGAERTERFEAGGATA